MADPVACDCEVCRELRAIRVSRPALAMTLTEEVHNLNAAVFALYQAFLQPFSALLDKLTKDRIK